MLAPTRTAEVDFIGLDKWTSRGRELQLEVCRHHGQETREESKRRETHYGPYGDIEWCLLLAGSRKECCVHSNDPVQEFMRRRDSRSWAGARMGKNFFTLFAHV